MIIFQSDNVFMARHKKIGRYMSHLIWWLLSMCLLSAVCAAADRGSMQPIQNTRSSLEERWGIKLLSIRLSAEGYMLDFRYRVLDPEKAKPLFDRQSKPYLVDEVTGAMFVVPEPPKVGALRTTRKPVPDRNYFILFANPGKFVKPGNKVTIVIGDFRAENLIVQ